MKKCFILILYFLINISLAYGFSVSEIKDYGTYSEISFEFKGHRAFLKIPDRPLEGNPWVWRAYFPTWHTEIDRELLAKGYHIAYVSTPDMFGSPESMAIWDSFYGHLINNYHLSPRVALEAVSRGGLYAHTWAKRNPTKVSCIYAEVPVCDFTTWPKQISEKDWKMLKESYRFSDEKEALSYDDMPIHQLGGLASLKVPVLHSICNIDKVVPPASNSLVFGMNYIKAGGPYGAIPMDKVFNVENMKGHHFHLEHVDKIVSFIHTNSFPVKSMLPSEKYHHYNGKCILRSLEKVKKDNELNIVFLGGSITYNPGWRNHLEKYFRSRFPDARLNFLMAGIPSLGSVPHVFRYHTDVLDHIVPDILFYEAAVNDRGNGYSVSEQQKSIEGIIRNTLSKNPNADIIMMHFADPQKIEDYNSGREPVEIVSHNEVASHYGIPVIDISREIYDRICNKEFSWEDDIRDLHPSLFGQEYYSMSIKSMMDTLIVHTPSSLELCKKSKLPKPMYRNCYSDACYMPVERTTGTFRFEEKYVPDNGQATREGFTGVPMLVGEKVGDKFRFEFSGNAVGVCVISGNDAGIIKYRVDSKPYKTVDLYTRWSAGLHLPWYIVLDDDLRRGKHTLEVEISSDRNEKSKGNACRIVHFLVNR